MLLATFCTRKIFSFDHSSNKKFYLPNPVPRLALQEWTCKPAWKHTELLYTSELCLEEFGTSAGPVGENTGAEHSSWFVWPGSGWQSLWAKWAGPCCYRHCWGSALASSVAVSRELKGKERKTGRDKPGAGNQGRKRVVLMFTCVCLFCSRVWWPGRAQHSCGERGSPSVRGWEPHPRPHHGTISEPPSVPTSFCRG